MDRPEVDAVLRLSLHHRLGLSLGHLHGLLVQRLGLSLGEVGSVLLLGLGLHLVGLGLGQHLLGLLLRHHLGRLLLVHIRLSELLLLLGKLLGLGLSEHLLLLRLRHLHGLGRHLGKLLGLLHGSPVDLGQILTIEEVAH